MSIPRLVMALSIAVLMLGRPPDTWAQQRDPLWNGAIVGAAVGAATGAAFTYAVRDSDLVFSQYLRGMTIFGAFGAAAGLGLDALLARVAPGPALRPAPLRLAPVVGRGAAGMIAHWRW